MKRRNLRRLDSSVIIILLFYLVNCVICQQSDSKLAISSETFCKQWQFSSICKVCQSLNTCCPKYCIQCSDQYHCISCQQGFKISNVTTKLSICVNINPQIDINRNKIDPKKCNKAYYYHPFLKYCQKCPNPNCQYCHSITAQCLRCDSGYQLSNKKCYFIQQNIKTNENITVYKKDINDNKNNMNLNYENGSKTTTNTNYDKDQNEIYLSFFILGTIFGFCMACILLKIFICLKRKCQSLYRKCRKCFNRKETKKLLQPQKSLDTVGETPTINDEQKQFAQIKDDQQLTRIQNDTICSTINKNSVKKSIITQDKD